MISKYTCTVHIILSFVNLDDSLNLDSLLIQIKPEVTPNWYKFGEAIGVDDKVLDRCIPYPPEESIVEVCDHWLRNHSGKPTWREVAEALGQTNFQQLAFDIEKVYETGKMNFVSIKLVPFIIIISSKARFLLVTCRGCMVPPYIIACI